jgi:hypothetical protein
MTEVKEQVQGKAEEAKEQVKQATGEAREQTRDRVRTEVDRRSTEAGQQVSDTAQAMRRVGETLREEGKDGPAKAAQQAAGQAERAGRWLQESDADRILRDVEDFGRRKPWAVALGGLALGIAAARFMKASSSDRYRSLDTNGAGSPRGRASGQELPSGGQVEPPAVPVPATPPTASVDPPSAG